MTRTHDSDSENSMTRALRNRAVLCRRLVWPTSVTTGGTFRTPGRAGGLFTPARPAARNLTGGHGAWARAWAGAKGPEAWVQTYLMGS